MCQKMSAYLGKLPSKKNVIVYDLKLILIRQLFIKSLET